MNVARLKRPRVWKVPPNPFTVSFQNVVDFSFYVLSKTIKVKIKNYPISFVRVIFSYETQLFISSFVSTFITDFT